MTDYTQTLIDLGYIVASILFILGIKMLGRPERARRGNMVSALGMLIAVTAVLFECCLSFTWVIVGLVIGSSIGVIAARLVKMTAMPQMVALLNGFGGIASLLIGWENFHSQTDSTLFVRTAVILAVLIGGVAFSGSLIAYGKLAEKIPGKPIFFKEPEDSERRHNPCDSRSYRPNFKISHWCFTLSDVYHDHRAFTGSRNTRRHSYRRCGHAGGHCPIK